LVEGYKAPGVNAITKPAPIDDLQQPIKDIGTAEEYARCATWNGREMVTAQSLDEMRRIFLDEIFPF
jgi:hypothetical protein